MQKKDFNTRTCVVCRKKFKKDELLRFIKVNNQLVLDVNKNQLGRGFYVYPSNANFEKMLKTKMLERQLKINITNDQYNELKQYFNK